MRVLIVDDEAYICEYLQHLLNWRHYGFDEVIKETNAAKAEKLLLEDPVELLITDIRMPEISGIDLLHYVHDQDLPTKVVFLSGYSEFEYAQQAIRFGLSDYLLKPVDKDDLDKTLKTVMSTVTHSEAIEDEQDLYTTLLSQLALFKTADYQIDGMRYVFARLKNGESPAAQSYFESGAGIVSAQAITDQMAETSATFQLSNRRLVRELFYAFVGNGRHISDDILVTIRQVFVDLINHQSSTVEFNLFWRELDEEARRVFLINGLAYLFFYVDADVKDEVSLFDIEEGQDHLLEALRTYFKGSSRAFSSREIIENTNRYINDNLNSDLSLERLAARAYLNAAYFSTIYKQETGVNVSTYIQGQRLEKAAELLLDSQLKVSDIGTMVGYGHTQYFTKLFRERYGVTPNRYRRAHATMTTGY